MLCREDKIRTKTAAVARAQTASGPLPLQTPVVVVSRPIVIVIENANHQPSLLFSLASSFVMEWLSEGAHELGVVG